MRNKARFILTLLLLAGLSPGPTAQARLSVREKRWRMNLGWIWTLLPGWDVRQGNRFIEGSCLGNVISILTAQSTAITALLVSIWCLFLEGTR